MSGKSWQKSRKKWKQTGNDPVTVLCRFVKDVLHIGKGK